MAIQWADDFGGYGVGAGSNTRMLNGLYATVVGAITEDPDPLSTDPVWERGNSAFQCLRRVFSASRTECGVALRVWMSSLPSSTGNRWGLGFHDLDNNPLVTLICETNGAITIKKGSYTDNTVVTSTGPALTAGAWNHIEWHVLSGDDTGSVEVRVNGVPVILEEDIVDVFGGSMAQFCMNSASGGAGYNFYIRDLVLWDATGSYANDFLGSVSVIGLQPTADVSFNWDAVGVTDGYEALANDPPLDDTEYISADDTPPAASTFSLSNLPDDVTSVKALITQVRARKSDGGDGNLQMGLISNGDTWTGADRPLTTAFQYWFDVSHTDPDTSSPWSPSAVDNVILQLDRTL